MEPHGLPGAVRMRPLFPVRCTAVGKVMPIGHPLNNARKTMTRNFRPAVDLLARKQAHDYHLKAAQHCELASRCHKEAALHIDGGDLRAASSQSKLADEHIGYAMLESRQASPNDVAQTSATP